MRKLLFAFALLCPAPALAQQVSSLDPPATQAAMAALQAQIPQPADSVPPSEMVGGAAGSSPTFRRGDAAQPRITRAAAVTTASDGSWSVT